MRVYLKLRTNKDVLFSYIETKTLPFVNHTEPPNQSDRRNVSSLLHTKPWKKSMN